MFFSFLRFLLISELERAISYPYLKSDKLDSALSFLSSSLSVTLSVSPFVTKPFSEVSRPEFPVSNPESSDSQSESFIAPEKEKYKEKKNLMPR